MQKKKSWTMLATAALLLAGTTLVGTVHAAGFNERYKIRVGDENGDGTNDAIFVDSPGAILIPLDDIPVVLVSGPRDFILRSNGQQGFTIDGQLSTAELTAVASWAASDAIDLFIRDVDLDSYIDLELVGVAQAVPNHFDQIVYAPTTASASPSQITSQNKKFSYFHEQLFGWLKDNNYFDINAPRKITSAEPAQRVWFGSLADAGNVYLMNKWLQDCSDRYPNGYCAVSDRAPPPPCERTVSKTDAYGNYIGSGPDDICRKPRHVIVYVPGAITTSPDYSVFDAEARETAEILDRLNDTCPVLPTSDEERLAQIAEMIYQHAILRDIPAADKLNGWSHTPFPGDELFNPLDKTYHHYDVRTKLCSLSEPNCNLATIRDNVGRQFSYPARLLRPNLTSIPGPSQPVFVASPGFTSFPWAYIVPAGPINQRFIQSQPWAGGTQNLTEPPHISYPGTISRYVEQTDDALYMFTHGIGINRAKCALTQASRGYHIFLAKQNDEHGPKAFKALDKQLIRHWKRNFTPNAAPDPTWTGEGNPADIPAPHQ